MLKGTILKNLFKLESARCGSPETAEHLVRKWLPNTYRDGEVLVSHIEGLGDIEHIIIREAFEPVRGKGRAWRIVLKTLYADEEE